VLVHGQHRGRRFFAPARDAGIAVRAVPDEREPIRNRRGPHAELLDDAALVEPLASHAVEADDTVADDALSEILVRRADHDTFDTAFGGEARCAGRERVVAFELDHRPHHDAERAARVLGWAELRIEIGIDALARLVAGVQIVAERLDHVIEGDGHVRDVPFAEQRQHRSHERAHGADLRAARVTARLAAVVRAEQLERAVDEMNLHATPIVIASARTPVLV
jgi:hypothetical protein